LRLRGASVTNEWLQYPKVYIVNFCGLVMTEKKVRKIDARDFGTNLLGLSHVINKILQAEDSVEVLHLYNGAENSPYSRVTRQLVEYDFGRPGESVLVKRTRRSYIPQSGN
jgi:hypothetical protein